MRRILGILFLVTALYTLSAVDNNIYSKWQGIFENFYDPNTGLTVFPTLEIPLGGKYEGMGTAYTAISNDISYIESNPSGSSILDYTELAFLHHSWIADTNLEGAIYTMRINNLGIGIGGKFLYLPFTAYNDWGERTSRGNISETVGTLNISYNFFSNYYFYGIAIGTNLKVAYRNIPAIIYPNQSAFAFMADFGMLTRFNLLKFYISRTKNFSIGAVVKNIGPFVLSEPLPSSLTFGIGYSPIRPVTMSFDFNYPFSFNSTAYPAENWNIAGGINVVITDFLSIQGGFQFKGDNPRVSLGTSVALDKVSFVSNYNLDLSGRLNPLDKFSILAKLNLGDNGRKALREKADELYLAGLEEYAKGNIADAIKYWNKVLEIDPQYIPAKENIEMAKRTLQLQKTMEQKQQIGQ